MIGYIKTLAIILLACNAMFLTSRLWFNELAGSSFTNAMLVLFERAQPETGVAEQNSIIKPARVITAFGGGRYDIMYNDIDASVQKRDCDEAITLALASGEYVASPAAATLESLLEAPGYAYHYNCAVPAAAFVNVYPQRRSMLTSRVKTFAWVFVAPDADARGVRVAFLDTDGRVHEYRAGDIFLETRITNNIQNISDNGERLVYARAGGFFIPQTEGWDYTRVAMENQYMDQGGLLLDYVRRRVGVFFDGAGSKWESSRAQSLTYSDENTVVRYFPAETHNGLDVLEYANYSVIDRRIVTTLASDCNAAVRFIARDSAVENEFYLAAAEDTGSRRVFYFNYAVNDLPISMSYENTMQTGLVYPIEITLENGVVTRYRKLVYRFVNVGTQTAAVSYEAVLGNLLTLDERPEDLPISAVDIGYRMDITSDMSLYWLIELDGRVFSRSVQAGDAL